MASEKNVLHVTDFFPPTAGGVERVCAGLCGELAARGLKVQVLTPEPGAGGDLPVPQGVRVHRFPVSRNGTRAHYTSMIQGARQAFRRLASKTPPDLIHSHLTLTTLPLLSEAMTRGIPIVATFYGPWFWEYRFEVRRLKGKSLTRRIAVEILSPVMAACMRRAQEAVIDRARAVVVLSRHSQRELSMLGWTPRRGSLAVIPGGFEPARFRPAEDRTATRRRLQVPDGSILILSIRRLVPRMGLENLVKALGLLSGRRKDLRLVIGGEGPLRDRLESLAGRLGVTPHMALLGRVPDRDLPSLYSAADLLVMPSVALEGFGLPVIEAWACGLPAVGSPRAAVGEMIRSMDPALVASSPTPEDLAGAIERALGMDRAALSSQCLERSKAYRWPVIAERYIELYRRVIEEAVPVPAAGPEKP